ncbi:hypothetical protein C8R47DRAFT_1201143, partial [Mycena vitilis]
MTGFLGHYSNAIDAAQCKSMQRNASQCKSMHPMQHQCKTRLDGYRAPNMYIARHCIYATSLIRTNPPMQPNARNAAPVYVKRAGIYFLQFYSILSTTVCPTNLTKVTHRSRSHFSFPSTITMSDALPARGQCLLCRCTASTFLPFPETLSYTPQTIRDMCQCEHDYTSHTLILRDNPSDPYNSMRRGTNVHHQCGGFVKPPGVLRGITPCVACEQPLLHHLPPSDVVQAASAQTAARPAPVASTVSTTFTFAPAPRPSHQLDPPAHIYRDVIPRAVEHYTPSPVGNFELDAPPADFMEARDLSRMANLPQHNTVRPRPGPPRGGGRTSSSRARGVNVFSATSSVASNRRKVTKKNPTKRTYLVCILPFCHGEGEEASTASPDYKFHTMRDTLPLIDALTAYNLCFEIVLDVEGSNGGGGHSSTWAVLDQAILEHLATNHIHIVHGPGYILGDYDKRSWGVLEARSGRVDVQRLLSFLALFSYQFDEDRLFNAGKKIAHPTRKDLVILPIAPLHANLTASIIPRSLSPETATHGPTHRCFAWHVWHLAFSNDQDEDPECF